VTLFTKSFTPKFTEAIQSNSSPKNNYQFFKNFKGFKFSPTAPQKGNLKNQFGCLKIQFLLNTPPMKN